MRHVIIGNGIAGWTAAQAIRAIDKKSEITIVSKEDKPTYYRVLITHYLAGHTPESNLTLANQEQIDALGATQYLGKKINKILPDKQQILLDNDKNIPYDRLLLATGASPVLPAYPGKELLGVYTLRTISDAKNIAMRARSGNTAVVVGGGFVSMKATAALTLLGVRVKMIMNSGQVLSQAMNSEPAAIIRRHMEDSGVEVIPGCDIESIEGKNGAVTGVVLNNGIKITCDLVVIGKGVKANVELAREAGIRVGYGLPVDEYMQTSKEHIYAAGDVAQAYDFVHENNQVQAIWPAAVTQGNIAGKNMAGLVVPYEGGIAMNTADILGLPAINMGITRIPADSGFITFDYESPGIYKRLIVKDGLLKGVILVGEVETAGLLHSLIRKKVNISSWVEQLIAPDFTYGKLFILLKKTLSKETRQT